MDTVTTEQVFISQVMGPYLYPFLIMPIVGLIFSLMLSLKKGQSASKLNYALLVLTQLCLLGLSGLLHFSFLPQLELNNAMGVKLAWFPEMGIYFDIGVDSLSSTFLLFAQLGFLLISLFLGRFYSEQKQVSYLTLTYLVMLSVNGTYLAQNFIFFYLFWELVLIPILIMVAIGNIENYRASLLKFFLITFAGSICMLASILVLAVMQHQTTGVWSFAFTDLINVPGLQSMSGLWIMLGFFVSFAIKGHVFPFHTWLPQLYEKSPLPVLFLVSGVLFNMACYGFLRFFPTYFVWPLTQTPWGDALAYLGAFGIIYGAWVALAQTDARRMLAYLSVSHVGYFVFAIFSKNGFAFYGSLMQTSIHSLIAIGLLGIFVPLFIHTPTHGHHLTHWRGLAKTYPAFAIFAFVLCMSGNLLFYLGPFKKKLARHWWPWVGLSWERWLS
jgi:NADH-quinone oxidoreductase subunit M